LIGCALELGASPTFIGLGNYVALGSDPIFRQVLRNSAEFLLGTVPVTVALALVLAGSVRRSGPGIRIERSPDRRRLLALYGAFQVRGGLGLPAAPRAPRWRRRWRWTMHGRKQGSR